MIVSSWWSWSLPRWSSFSHDMLRATEKAILKYLRLPYRGYYVDLGEGNKIWTIAMNESNKDTPVVLLHGLGAGSALWVMNLDDIAKHRAVYSIDILGFGRSSRPDFDKDANVAEMQFIKSINEWRREMNIRKMILCGHSFGAYLACSYALVYPDHIQHLILADSWGMPKKPENVNQKYNVPFWVQAVAYAVQPLNPLWMIRAVGPFGQWVVEKTRPDIMKKFNAVVRDETAIAKYIHQCNAQSPTGESAFHSMMEGFGWAKNPLINRIHEMRDDVPLTLIYGSKSWVDNTSGDIIKKSRPKSYVNVHIINQAGHHVYADTPSEFNSIIVKTCKISDEMEMSKRIEDENNNEEENEEKSEKS